MLPTSVLAPRFSFPHFQNAQKTVTVCLHDICCRSQAAPGHPARGFRPGTLLRWFSTVIQGFGFSFFRILLLTRSDSPPVLGCPGREEAGATPDGDAVSARGSELLTAAPFLKGESALHSEDIELSGINPWAVQASSSSVLPGQSGKAGGWYGVSWLPSQKRRPECGSEITHRTLDRTGFHSES